MPVHRHPLATSAAIAKVPADDALVQRLERSSRLLGLPSGRLAARFYERLFRRAPELRSRFAIDVSGQGAKLEATLHWVVQHLGQSRAIREELRTLGRRHVEYGATAAHYQMFQEELIGAMVDVAPPEWTAEDTADWTVAMRLVCETMLEGAPR